MPPVLCDALADTIHLSFEQTVPRSLVHKRAIENVLLTEISATAGDRFICAGRIPTAHRFFNDAGRTPHDDILFYTEIGRQASLAVSHGFLDVSRDDVFVFEGSDAALADASWNEPDDALDTVVIEIRAREIVRRRNNAVTRVTAEHAMWVGARQVFWGTGAWTIHSAALFQRLRRTASTPTRPIVAPRGSFQATRARVPNATGDNVVISAPRWNDDTREFASSLVVDATHPYFFDHPCDHVPGMLLLEGCAQLALSAFTDATGGRAIPRVAAYGMTFSRFVECDSPTTLTASLDAGGSSSTGGGRSFVHVNVMQNDAVCGTALLTLTTSSVA